MIEMQIDQKEEDIAKCKKRLEKIESEKRGEDETKDAAVRNLESQIEEKDKLLSECNVSNEKSAKALEELTLENTSNQEKNVDLGLQVQELTEKHTECVGKAASVPPPSECNNEEDKATINRLQKEIDEKQLKFDSSIIQMQEDHAQALMLAKQSVVEVDANGDSATASTGSDGGENKDNHDNENGEIKLTDDASFDKCSQLQSDFDKLKKEMDACDADLTIAKAVIDEHAVVSPEVEQLAALSTDEEKQNFVKSLTDARDNCLADLRDANQALKESKESNTAIATNGGDQCQNDLAVAMGTIEEKDMKIKEFEAGVDMDCHSQLVQVKGELAQLKSNDNGDNANENNKDEAEHSNFEKCKKDLDNANSKIEEQALKIMSNDNGNCPPETIKTMETCTADLKSCHAALGATAKPSDPSSSSGEISSDTDVVTDPLLLGEEAGDPLGLAATGAAADIQSNSTIEEMKDQLARLNAKLIEDNRIHDETVDGVRLMMQFLKDSPSDELAQGILEVFSMNNKIHNMTDFNAWMRQKIVGGEFNNKAQTGQMIKELQGMMVNSVLSGPKTPLRAIMGTTSNAYLNSFNTALGALVRTPFTGDTTTLRASAASLKSMAEIIPDAWKVFKTKVDAYWTGDIATIRNRYQEYQPLDVNWELMGKWAHEQGTRGEQAAFNIANAARWVNSQTFFTYSTRIMAATDDTFRYIMAKSRSREKALREALDAKAAGDIFDITPDILKQAEDLEYKKLLTPDGDLDLAKDSYLNSQFKEVTLTSELGVMGKNLDQVFNDAPFLKPFFLFARTGINGLKVSAKNSPLMSLLLKESRDIAFGSVDDLPKLAKYGIETAEDLAQAKALFAGRQALGITATIPITQKYLAGELTGNGPVDHSMKQTWIDTGWQPRSMKIGDAWVSYDSFEPWNLVLSSIADIGDNQKLMGDEWAEDRLWRTAMAVGLSNPASKTYLQGLNQLIDFARGQPGSGQRVIANLANNTFPMSSLRNEIGKVLTPYMRELNSGVGQSIRNRNLTFEHLTKDELPIKYDMLNGEPIKNWNFMQRMVNSISPVTFNIDKKSKGRTLLWNSGYDLRLTTFSAPDGTSLEDSPRIRSMLQKAMGDYNLEEVLNQLAERDDVKASMARMDKLRRSGQFDLNPSDSFLHLDLISMHIEEAKRQAWASIQHEEEVQDLLQKREELKGRQRVEKYNTQNYSSEKDPLTMRNK